VRTDTLFDVAGMHVLTVDREQARFVFTVEWLLHARDRHDHPAEEPELHHSRGLTHSAGK
jgi:hypothetical protein